MKMLSVAVALSRKILDVFVGLSQSGYKPIVPFEEGLKRTVDWYRSVAATA